MENGTHIADITKWIERDLNWIEGFLAAVAESPGRANERIVNIRRNLKAITDTAGDFIYEPPTE